MKRGDVYCCVEWSTAASWSWGSELWVNFGYPLVLGDGCLQVTRQQQRRAAALWSATPVPRCKPQVWRAPPLLARDPIVGPSDARSAKAAPS